MKIFPALSLMLIILALYNLAFWFSQTLNIRMYSYSRDHLDLDLQKMKKLGARQKIKNQSPHLMRRANTERLLCAICDFTGRSSLKEFPLHHDCSAPLSSSLAQVIETQANEWDGRTSLLALKLQRDNTPFRPERTCQIQ